MAFNFDDLIDLGLDIGKEGLKAGIDVGKQVLLKEVMPKRDEKLAAPAVAPQQPAPPPAKEAGGADVKPLNSGFPSWVKWVAGVAVGVVAFGVGIVIAGRSK